MFKLNIFGNKKPSGQVELNNIAIEIAEDKDTLFNKAVKKEAVRSLAKDIKYELDCFTWGKDRIDATVAASKMFREHKLPSTDVMKAYPKAFYAGGYFEIPSAHSNLASALAEKWVEENY